MSHNTFLKIDHTMEIYRKVETISPAGQKKHSLEFVNTLPCRAETAGSFAINTPYVGNIEEMTLLVPRNYIGYVDYGYRLKNLKDRYGNIIDSATYEIVATSPLFQYNGKLHHYSIRIRKVVQE